jgi:hypothetical protein
MRRVLAPVVMIVGATACGPSQERDGAGRSEQFSEAFARIVCKKNLACCTSPETTQELCESRTRLYLNRLRDSNDSGKEVFDSELADTCLRELGGLGCTDWVAVVEGAPPMACRSYAKGRLADGESCGGDLECQSHFCNGNKGVCEARLGQDAECDGLNNQCAPGMSCGEGTIPGSFCGRPRLQGASCSLDADCFSFKCTAKTCATSCWYDPDRYDTF